MPFVSAFIDYFLNEASWGNFLNSNVSSVLMADLTRIGNIIVILEIFLKTISKIQNDTNKYASFILLGLDDLCADKTFLHKTLYLHHRERVFTSFNIFGVAI